MRGGEQDGREYAPREGHLTTTGRASRNDRFLDFVTSIEFALPKYRRLRPLRHTPLASRLGSRHRFLIGPSRVSIQIPSSTWWLGRAGCYRNRTKYFFCGHLHNPEVANGPTSERIRQGGNGSFGPSVILIAASHEV